MRKKIPKAGETKPIETTPVTTKTLASDGDLEELRKKDRRSFIKWPACHARSYRTDIVSVPREAWQQPAGVPCRTGQEGRWDKTILIPDFVSTENYDGSVGWGRTRIFGSKHACIILRGPRSKPKLENILLPTWVAANARIMHKLTNIGT